MTTCEAMKLLSNSTSNQEVILCKYSDIDWTIYKPKRAGIIVYTYSNNDYYFAFGLDRKHNELTDFGGGVKQSDMFSDLGSLRRTSGRVTEHIRLCYPATSTKRVCYV